MIKKEGLPYFKVKNSTEHFMLARFLRRKFFPALKRKFPLHYLVTSDHRLYLKFLKTASKTHPYFLRFDIEQYFPSINHSILLSEIKFSCLQLTRKSISRRFNRQLKHKLPAFLKLSPYPNQGLPIGSPLSHILAGIYLFKLDLALGVPFLRFCDDYLTFGKTERQLQKILTTIINPILIKLNLTLNIKKLKAGKFHRDSVTFLGFDYFAGYISISQDKTEEFKQRIIKITHLTGKKPTPVIIKLLNNKILGFGHYYKFAKGKQAFDELDGFIRARLRRYINRNKDSKDRLGNLILTNQALQELKLKSLKEIYEKYASKRKVKLKETIRIKAKTGKRQPLEITEKLSLRANDSERSNLFSNVLTELKQLTTLVRKLEAKIDKMANKLE